MTTAADRKTDDKPKYRVVGTRPIRHDGYDKVTGRAKYGADVQLPGMLYGVMLRSPHAHARIRSIDASKAEALPGVRGVITARDLPIMDGRPMDWGNVMANPQLQAEIGLANGKVRYQGQGVAAVAADSLHLAQEAAELIEVDYEVLPPVLDVLEAMKEGAPLIHETLTSRNKQEWIAPGDDTGVHSNIASHVQFRRGDPDRAFEDADVVVEREFTTKMVHQGYIEPHNSTAYWSPEGNVTVWTSTQGHFLIRKQTAEILDIPESQVKVVPMEIGGGFGAKAMTVFDAVTAVLAKKTGRPVKIVMSRKDEFEAAGPASGTVSRIKIGADKAGRITAATAWLAYEAGAFPGSPAASGAATALAPYRMDNFQVDAFDVVVNKAKVAPYRAPGAPQAAFGVESLIDELAERLGMDPMELRLKNVTREGDRHPSGLSFPRIGGAEVEEAIIAHPHYTAQLEGPNRGRGVAMGYWQNGGHFSSVTVSVNADGRVSLVEGSPDIGGSRVALAMQLAEVLGLTAQDIIPTVADTDSVGWNFVTGGSRTAFSSGIAVVNAAHRVIDEMKRRAAILWEVKPEDVSFDNGYFINDKSPDDRRFFKELAVQHQATGGPVTVSATSDGKGVGPCFCGAIVDVEVDPDTGKVEILRFTCVEDVGTAAHPSYVEGQMQGGSVQGIGWALNEEYFYDDSGLMANSSFLDYRMPTALDLPMIDTVMVEVPNPGHPFGVRGVGEVSIIPPLAAIANAIHAATGVRMTSLPMSPGAVRDAIAAKADGR